MPSCGDGVSEFEEAICNVKELDARCHFGTCLSQSQKTVDYVARTLGLVTFGAMAYKVFNVVQEKAVSLKKKEKPPDYEKSRPQLGWFPLEVVKRTFAYTTQLAMKLLIQIPFQQHHKS